MGALALLLVLTGGTAYALDGSNTVFSDDIVDGQVKTPDLDADAVVSAKILDNQVRGRDIADGSVQEAEIAGGAVRTGEIANGQVQAEDLADGVKPGASGARAWGTFDGSGNLLRSKNVTGVTLLNTPGHNQYCIDPGADINADTAVLMATETLPNSVTSATYNDVSHVEWNSESSDCPAGTMEVQTFAGLADDRTFGDYDYGGFRLSPNPQGFTFAIP